MAKAGRQWRGTVRVLSALALLFLSFSHQPAFSGPVTARMAAEYVLPDGTVGDICFGADGVDGNNSSHDGLTAICDYCRLAVSTVLPPPPDNGFLVAQSFALADRKPATQPAPLRQQRVLPQSRAPPSLL